jgi:hypothetical protein
MKRKEIIQKLLKEGFSEKTLINFSDIQLKSLSVRILGESDVMISKNDPQLNQKVNDAKKTNKSIETYESKDENPCWKGFKKVGMKTKNGKEVPNCVPIKKKKKNESVVVTEWVKSIAEQKYHTFTSKNEIMEMISSKLDKHQVGGNVKKGHNGIPEFMTYSSIKSGGGTEIAPSKPKTAPTTIPGNPTRKSPYNPGPGTNPKPKSLKEKEEVVIDKRKINKVNGNGNKNK